MNCAEAHLITALLLSVIDELILVGPAVELSNLKADGLCGSLCGFLSHSAEVSLSACGRHIEEEVLGEGAVLDVSDDR